MTQNISPHPQPPPKSSIPWYSTLRFQFMMVAIGLIMVTMVIFALGTVIQTGAVFDDQIRKGGAALISSVSVMARHYFEDLAAVKLHADARTLQKKYETDLQKLLLTGPQEGIVGAFDVLNIFFVAASDADPFIQQYGTVRAVGQGAYNLNVYGGPHSQSRYVAKVRDQYITTDILISEGVLEVVRTGESLPARIFEQPVRNEQRKPICTVYLILSAQRIRDEQIRLILRILIAFIIAAFIGVATSFTLTPHITNPMTELVKDFQIVSSGNLNHRAHSTASNELGYLAHAFNEMTVKLQAAHAAELELKTREHEMKLATQIQASLLPKTLPNIPGYDIAAYYKPSREVGGDYYDFINLGNHRLGIVVADVSGKGIPASMIMAMTRSVIRYAATHHTSCAETLREVNHVISPDLREGTFVTALFALLNPEEKKLTFSSAGHNPLLYLKASTGECIHIKPKGIALGLDRGHLFNSTIAEESLILAPGDKLLFYTDGIIEARSVDGQQFGKERLAELLRHSRGYDSNATMKSIIDAVSYHTGTEAQYDDITAALITVL